MRKGTLLLGLVLILIGVYSLLEVFSPGVPRLERLWPVALIAGGITLLISYFRPPREDPARVFWGVALTLSGFIFLLITLTGENYAILRKWWPAFIIILGISFLSLWLAEGLRDWGALFLAMVSLAFGGVYMAVNLRIFGPHTAAEIGRLWPAILIFVGLILVLRGTLGRKREK